MSPSFGDMILGGRADGPVLPLDGGVLRDFHLKHLWPQEEQLVWPHDSLQRPPEGLAGGAEALFSQTYHLLRVCPGSQNRHLGARRTKVVTVRAWRSVCSRTSTRVEKGKRTRLLVRCEAHT